MRATFVCFVVFIFSCEADVYLHNPRGSNNRLNENGRDRQNGNRMFDSQNNNRGGYNQGSLYYYPGSSLPIEWTNQHSCGDPNSHCELIIQYMCDHQLRDGERTNTIPENNNCQNQDCNTDFRFGMHENFEYYMNCRRRGRNQGLFLGSQNLNSNKRFAKNTRQNPNGDRRGYECPEERDYYPYWHPTPWKDIAVFTNQPERCQYYREQSENVKGRWACYIPDVVLKQFNFDIPNNKDDCEAFTHCQSNTRGVWKLFEPHNVTSPLCQEANFSRDNHLGNGIGGLPNVFNWTVPDDVNDRCALRLRYNISTADYSAWTTTAAQNPAPGQASIPFAEMLGFPDEDTADSRGYKFQNNPQVNIFPGVNRKLRLAINTAQYGRTFQDRSHRFAIRARPSDLAEAEIVNVNVRGKRGNIVQVYPAVEYDFVPNTVRVKTGDYIHFQWTGSDTNPNNNNGEGRAGTDRSNVILQAARSYLEGNPAITNSTSLFGHWGHSYPFRVGSSSFLGFTEDNIKQLALPRPMEFSYFIEDRPLDPLLNDATRFFDMGPVQVTRSGTFHYMCTRNNNFSNRSQKGRIIVASGNREAGSEGTQTAQPDMQPRPVISPKTYPMERESSGEETQDDTPVVQPRPMEIGPKKLSQILRELLMARQGKLDEELA